MTGALCLPRDVKLVVPKELTIQKLQIIIGKKLLLDTGSIVLYKLEKVSAGKGKKATIVTSPILMKIDHTSLKDHKIIDGSQLLVSISDESNLEIPLADALSFLDKAKQQVKICVEIHFPRVSNFVSVLATGSPDHVSYTNSHPCTLDSFELLVSDEWTCLELTCAILSMIGIDKSEAMTYRPRFYEGKTLALLESKLYTNDTKICDTNIATLLLVGLEHKRPPNSNEVVLKFSWGPQALLKKNQLESITYVCTVIHPQEEEFWEYRKGENNWEGIVLLTVCMLLWYEYLYKIKNERVF